MKGLRGAPACSDSRGEVCPIWAHGASRRVKPSGDFRTEVCSCTPRLEAYDNEGSNFALGSY